MRKLALYILLILFLSPACSKHATGTSTVVKPKYHHSWFNKKKDRQKKRTKQVRMKN